MDAYEALDVIGSGSFGVIRKVRRKADGRLLVRKEIDYGKMTEKEKKQLVAEVNILRELRHPNIVRYYERFVDRPGSRIYIIMEWCEGGDLAGIIKQCKKENKRLPEDVIWNLMTQLLLALQECHHGAAGSNSASSTLNGTDANSRSSATHPTILHRDIKPDNVFLDGNQNVKLGDFGLSRIISSPELDFAKTFVGTPFYMSPELVSETSYNTKSDIWALGCLIYELCALEPPFQSKTQAGLTQKIRSGKVDPLPPQYSNDLAATIKAMLNVNHMKRPSTTEFLKVYRIRMCIKERNMLAEMKKRDEEIKRREAALDAREAQLVAREEEMRRFMKEVELYNNNQNKSGISGGGAEAQIPIPAVFNNIPAGNGSGQRLSVGSAGSGASVPAVSSVSSVNTSGGNSGASFGGMVGLPGMPVDSGFEGLASDVGSSDLKAGKTKSLDYSQERPASAHSHTAVRDSHFSLPLPNYSSQQPTQNAMELHRVAQSSKESLDAAGSFKSRMMEQQQQQQLQHQQQLQQHQQQQHQPSHLQPPSQQNRTFTKPSYPGGTAISSPSPFRRGIQLRTQQQQQQQQQEQAGYNRRDRSNPLGNAGAAGVVGVGNENRAPPSSLPVYHGAGDRASHDKAVNRIGNGGGNALFRGMSTPVKKSLLNGVLAADVASSPASPMQLSTP
ncbi:G2-specific serine/threonine protein kinase [Chytriomyces hyalinus]|nr:G2-specific serine/threonine protein kinase [Chytriomyces hyalinus]